MDKMDLLGIVTVVSLFISFFLIFFLLTVKTEHKTSNRIFALFLLITAINTSEPLISHFTNGPSNLGILRTTLSFLQTGTYDDFLYQQGIETKIVERNKRLYVESQVLDFFKSRKENEMVQLKKGVLKITDYPNLLKFDFRDEKAVSVTQIRGALQNKIDMKNTIKESLKP